MSAGTIGEVMDSRSRLQSYHSIAAPLHFLFCFEASLLTHVQFHKSWTIEQIPAPLEALGEHDILIKMAVALFCHTDMIMLDGKFHDKASGLPGSHEPSGTVVALGTESAKSSSLGDRVIAIGIQCPCGNCIDCNSPEEFRLSCKFNKGNVGISAAGAFQEYNIVDERFTVRIPDSLSFLQAAPLTCAGCTSW